MLRLPVATGRGKKYMIAGRDGVWMKGKACHHDSQGNGFVVARVESRSKNKMFLFGLAPAEMK